MCVCIFQVYYILTWDVKTAKLVGYFKSMEQITIKATKREALRKQVKKLRAKDKLPAVLYGHELETQSIQVNEKEFVQAFKKAGESIIIR